MYQVISKADTDCQDVKDSIDSHSEVLRSNDGKLIRMQGRVSSDGVTDEHVNSVKIPSALIIER